MSATLPALALTDDGRILAPDTGEVLDEAAAADALAETLRTYARAKVEADALAMRMQDAEDAAIARLWGEDSDYHDCKVRRDMAITHMAAIQASLDGLFAGRDGRQPVKIDMGDVMVTWGKARETVTLAHPASWYATEDARQELVAVLYRLRCGEMASPNNGDLADAIIAWLAPTTKTGELPPASVTVRAGKGGAK